LISIITPILNEEKGILPFLKHLMEVNNLFEVILVDGGSSDNTVNEVTRSIEGCDQKITLLQSDRGRAIQMNRGAKKARGDILLFLHSDCQIPNDALTVIERVLSTKAAIGGGFKQTFSASQVSLRVLSSFGNLRARLTSIFFGDNGIFLLRDVFRKIGGYDETSFLEDMELCQKAKKYGKLIQINRYISTSPRRFFAEGEPTIILAYVVAYGLNFFKVKPYFLKKYFLRGNIKSTGSAVLVQS
jgi:rSAM/selenodomain-associated transferase 2